MVGVTNLVAIGRGSCTSASKLFAAGRQDDDHEHVDGLQAWLLMHTGKATASHCRPVLLLAVEPTARWRIRFRIGPRAVG